MRAIRNRGDRGSAAAAGFVALAVADSALAGRPGKPARALRFLTKPLLMPALATAYRDRTAGRTDVLRGATLAAQLFSWSGDLALLGRSERAFLGGVGSFFLAHAAYIAGFSSVNGSRPDLAKPGVRAALGIWVSTAPVMAIAAGRKDPALRAPVVAYSAALAAMFATSTLVSPSVPMAARRRIVLGTGLFLVSDTILATQEFLLPAKKPALERAVMATYTAGQGLIAAGAARA